MLRFEENREETKVRPSTDDNQSGEESRKADSAMNTKLCLVVAGIVSDLETLP